MTPRDELVRLDETGAAHPVGKTASQRLRARQGAFRLMPGPAHVIFMRYVGEDGKRDEQDGAVVRLAGEVTAPGTLCDVVALIAQAGWPGELLVVDGEKTRSIFFEGGNVIGAQSNAPGERIGEILYRFGVLTTEQVIEVSERVTAARRFGETAVDFGFVTRERLFDLMGKRTEEIVYATLLVADGMFYFLDRYEASRVAMRHHVSANGLLMEGVRRMDESKYFRDRIPSDAHVPVPIAGRRDPPKALAQVFAVCDGERSVAEIGRACSLSDFEVTQAVFQLVQSGFLHVNPPMPTGAQALVAIFNDAVRLIYKAADSVGKRAELCEHLASFATGAGVYDALFMGAGPRGDGTLLEERIAANIARLAGDDSATTLAQWLYEYVAFALFDAGSELGKAEEQELSRQVGDHIKVLAPKT